MSDTPDFKAIYPKSHYSMQGHSAEPAPDPPEPEDMDQPTYDDLVARGYTPEHAKSEAEHVAFCRRVYANSEVKPAPDLPES